MTTGSPNAHSAWNSPLNRVHNSTKGNPREGRKNDNCGGRGKKSAKFCAPTVRVPTLRAVFLFFFLLLLCFSFVFFLCFSFVFPLFFPLYEMNEKVRGNQGSVEEGGSTTHNHCRASPAKRHGTEELLHQPHGRLGAPASSSPLLWPPCRPTAASCFGELGQEADHLPPSAARTTSLARARCPRAQGRFL